MEFVKRIAYVSIGIQATLSFTVILFSAWQLNRCPVAEVVKANDEVDTASCPSRALYSTMLTSSLAFWFPSPLNALVESTLIPRQPYEREGDSQPTPTAKRKTKPKEDDSKVDK